MPRMPEGERLAALCEYERPLWAQGLLVAGMDEVGRGPLAGPVVVACVALPQSPLIEGVNDSKKISEGKRERLYDAILERVAGVGLGVVWPREIDEINILQATRRAFALAMEDMPAKPDHVLIDGRDGCDADCAQTLITGGDAKSYLIGAASIIAKVTRDRMMREYDAQYPQYGFAQHKGYGTAEHIAAIRAHGPCELHRMSFLGKILGGD